MRLTLSWPRAERLPTVIVAIARHAREHRPRRLDGCRRGRAVRAEGVGEEADEHREAGRLGADREERGDRRGRALVDVGRPHVERRRADLVAEAGHHADGADEDDLGHLVLRGRRARRSAARTRRGRATA